MAKKCSPGSSWQTVCANCLVTISHLEQWNHQILCAKLLSSVTHPSWSSPNHSNQNINKSRFWKIFLRFNSIQQSKEDNSNSERSFMNNVVGFARTSLQYLTLLQSTVPVVMYSSNQSVINRKRSWTFKPLYLSHLFSLRHQFINSKEKRRVVLIVNKGLEEF